MRIGNLKKIAVLIIVLSMATCKEKSKESGLVTIAKLPSSLNEISGMVLLSDDHLYAINDSGNDNSVFKLNLDGEIIDQIKIPNATNIDWEDLAYDQEDHLYIGDFGNNNYKRKDFTIYKVSNILNKTPKVSTITFSYKNKESHNVEGFIYLNNYFYLFTKNKNKNTQHTTKVYRIPAIQGQHKAILIKTLDICGYYSTCRITGATINRDQNKLALLTKNKVFLFKKDDETTHFFDFLPAKLALNHTSQKESICFFNTYELLIAAEKSKNKKAKLYSLPLNN